MSGQDDILPPYDLALNYFILGGEKSPGKCEIRGASREWEWAELAGWGLDGASLILRRRLLPEFEIDVRLTTQTELDAWDDFYAKVLQSPVPMRRVPNPSARDASGRAQAQIATANQQLTIVQQQLAASGLSDLQKQQLDAQAQEASSRVDAARAALAAQGSSTSQSSRGLGIYHPRLARIGIGSVVILRVSQPVQGKGGSETFTIKMKEYRSPKFILTKPNGTIPHAAQTQPTAKTRNQIAIQEEMAKGKQLAVADDALGTFSDIIGGG